jgi:hypothetical protein
MAKQMFTLRDFSGGINSTKDPRDIQVNEFAYLKDFSLDENGALRPSGSLATHSAIISNKSITDDIVAFHLQNSAGYNLAYFETDHDIAKGGLTNQNIDFDDGGTQGISPQGPAAANDEELEFPQ